MMLSSFADGRLQSQCGRYSQCRIKTWALGDIVQGHRAGGTTCVKRSMQWRSKRECLGVCGPPLSNTFCIVLWGRQRVFSPSLGVEKRDWEGKKKLKVPPHPEQKKLYLHRWIYIESNIIGDIKEPLVRESTVPLAPVHGSSVPVAWSM